MNRSSIGVVSVRTDTALTFDPSVIISSVGLLYVKSSIARRPMIAAVIERVLVRDLMISVFIGLFNCKYRQDLIRY